MPRKAKYQPDAVTWALKDQAQLERAAKWCAQHGFTGDSGETLPPRLSARIRARIENDRRSFRTLVRLARREHEQAIAQLRDDLAAINEHFAAGGDAQDILAQIEARLTEAHKTLCLMSVPVADGKAWYAVAGRKEEWVVLVWVYGGLDGYVSPFGEVLAVLAETADEMLAGEAAKRRLFTGNQKIEVL
jgi:hypothetical protein